LFFIEYDYLSKNLKAKYDMNMINAVTPIVANGFVLNTNKCNGINAIINIKVIIIADIKALCFFFIVLPI